MGNFHLIKHRTYVLLLGATSCRTPAVCEAAEGCIALGSALGTQRVVPAQPDPAVKTLHHLVPVVPKRHRGGNRERITTYEPLHK